MKVCSRRPRRLPAESSQDEAPDRIGEERGRKRTGLQQEGDRLRGKPGGEEDYQSRGDREQVAQRDRQQAEIKQGGYGGSGGSTPSAPPDSMPSAEFSPEAAMP